MKYVIEYRSLIRPSELRHIPKADLHAIRRTIEEKLTSSPELFGKPLRFSLKGHRSLRVGDYHVIFRIDGAVVRVLLIAHRSSVYASAPTRIRRRRAA